MALRYLENFRLFSAILKTLTSENGRKYTDFKAPALRVISTVSLKIFRVFDLNIQILQLVFIRESYRLIEYTNISVIKWKNYINVQKSKFHQSFGVVKAVTKVKC